MYSWISFVICIPVKPSPSESFRVFLCDASLNIPAPFPGNQWSTLKKAMAPHSNTLAWKILWRKEPDRLQSMGSLRVGYDWTTSLSVFTFTHWRRKWNPLQYSCLENPRDRGAWWAAIYGATQSRTWLKWLSSSSSSSTFLWRRQWHPTPVLLPGKSHGWRSHVGYSPWGR